MDSKKVALPFGVSRNFPSKNSMASTVPIGLRIRRHTYIFFKMSESQTKLSEHETNRGEAEKSERVSGEIFEILGQPAAAIKPSESAFDNPTSRQKREPFCLIGAFDDFDVQMRQDFG